eukprot:gene9605-10592_t
MKKQSLPDIAKSEWRDSGSLIHKPTIGWTHSDKEIAEGVTYKVKYVGCMKILQSVKTLSLADRAIVIKYAMAKCCDKAGLMKFKKKLFKVPHSLSKIFGDIYTGYSRENVSVTISQSNIRIVGEKAGTCICDHCVENISFASAGDNDYSSFVAYIAKDSQFERACFVLECPFSLKANVIQTIGQAFEAKYKEFLSKPPKATEIPERFNKSVFPGETPMDQAMSTAPSIGYTPINQRERVDSSDSVEYSHLRHGDVPLNPHQIPEGNYDKLAKGHEYSTPRPDVLPLALGTDYSEITKQDDFMAIYDNPMASPTSLSFLTDINDNPSANSGARKEDNSPQYQLPADINSTDFAQYEFPRGTDNSAQYQALDNVSASPKPEPMYDNPKSLMQRKTSDKPAVQGSMKWETFDDNLTSSQAASASAQLISDPQGYLIPKLQPPPVPPPFNPYASLHRPEGAADESDGEYQSPQDITDYQHPTSRDYKPPETHYQAPPPVKKRIGSEVGSLDDKTWFHGHISRVEAEKLINKDGQFLVRESSSTKGQYVLCGMKDGQHRHLLLVDPQGQVRTKDRTFSSVEELILYHKGHNIPIISGGSDVHISIEVSCDQRKSRGDSVEL